MAFHKVTHVLFDMDGLLIDSESLYLQGFQNVVSKYGKEYSWETNVLLMGLQTREAAEYLITYLDLPITADVLIQDSQKQLEELFPNVALMRGAKRLVQHLYDNNIPMALATSSSKENANLKMTNHQSMFDQFTIKVFGSSDSEVKRGKPNPDIFLVSASRFADKPEPKKCLVFEDAPKGVLAAKAAGMQVVMIPDQRLDSKETRNATLTLSSLEDFKPELFGLPPYPDTESTRSV